MDRCSSRATLEAKPEISTGHRQLPPMSRSTAKELERREKTRRVQEEYPLPKPDDSIKDVDVLNTDAVILEGVFHLADLEAIVAHMKALRGP